MSADERPYITCRDLLEFLHLYLENELPEERRSEFDRHLAVCDPCQAYIRQYEDAIKLGKAAFDDPTGPEPWRGLTPERGSDTLCPGSIANNAGGSDPWCPGSVATLSRIRIRP